MAENERGFIGRIAEPLIAAGVAGAIVTGANYLVLVERSRKVEQQTEALQLAVSALQLAAASMQIRTTTIEAEIGRRAPMTERFLAMEPRVNQHDQELSRLRTDLDRLREAWRVRFPPETR